MNQNACPICSAQHNAQCHSCPHAADVSAGVYGDKEWTATPCSACAIAQDAPTCGREIVDTDAVAMPPDAYYDDEHNVTDERLMTERLRVWGFVSYHATADGDVARPFRALIAKLHEPTASIRDIARRIGSSRTRVSMYIRQWATQFPELGHILGTERNYARGQSRRRMQEKTN